MIEELVIDALDELSFVCNLDGTEATDELQIDSDFDEIVIE